MFFYLLIVDRIGNRTEEEEEKCQHSFSARLGLQIEYV